MTIRRATLSDRPAVVSLMKAFFFAKGFDRPDNPFGFVVPPDEAYAEYNFNARLDNPNACIFVHDAAGAARGTLIADAADHPFGRVRFACDFMFWIEPEWRGGSAAVRLIDAYKAWAREQGCTISVMKHFEGDDGVGALYARCGGRPVERAYVFPL